MGFVFVLGCIKFLEGKLIILKVQKFNRIVQLTLWPKLFPINCYLYEEQNELTLIDTGMQASFKGIVEEIQSLGKPLTNIILTHAHGDHLGALDFLKQEFPEVCVSISVRDSRLMKGDKSLDQDEPQTPIKGDIPKNLKTVPDRLLKENDLIGSLVVIETPGHTPGSISLFDKTNGILMAGDALQTQGKIAICGQFVPLFPFPAFGTWNKDLSLESAKKILKLNPSLLAVGHGQVIENPVQNIQQAIFEAEKKLKKVGA